MIKIIDNFLPEEEFKFIQSIMMSKEFKWYYIQGTAHLYDGLYHMTHMFFETPVGPNCKHLDIWRTFMNKVKAEKCTRIKANLTFRTSEPDKSGFHIDYDDDGKTAVFYINTNNGYTEFESGVRVSSVANRACIFDSNLQHRGTTHSEGGQQRIVVNFNYYA